MTTFKYLVTFIRRYSFTIFTNFIISDFFMRNTFFCSFCLTRTSIEEILKDKSSHDVSKLFFLNNFDSFVIAK